MSGETSQPDFGSNRVPACILKMDRVIWLRSEYTDKWDLLVSREEQAEILGTKPEGVSTRYSTYPEHTPAAAVKYGSRVWRVRSEVIDFAKWLDEQRNASPGKNQGRKIERTVADKSRSEIVRLTRRVEELEGHKAAIQVKLKEKTIEINQAKASILMHRERLDLAAREKAAALAEARARVAALEG